MVPNIAHCASLDFIVEAKRGAAELGQPATSILNEPMTRRVSPTLKIQVLGRWGSADGGRHRMVLEAARHKPAPRRSRRISRALFTEVRTESGSYLDDEAALFRDSLLPPHGEGSRKGDLKKLASTRPCQPTAAGWASNSAVRKIENSKRKHTCSLELGT